MKKAITDKRVALQLTQKELGDKIGVSQGAIAQWENGTTIPTTDKLPTLAKVLHCTVDELLREPAT